MMILVYKSTKELMATYASKQAENADTANALVLPVYKSTAEMLNDIQSRVA
ncbi:MAG: hypothetical protein AAGI36_04955 [Pseudomonadota bacterium]